MDEELNINLDLKQPQSIIMDAEISARLKMLVELNIEILAVLSKKDLGELRRAYSEKWKKYFDQKIDSISKAQ